MNNRASDTSFTFTPPFDSQYLIDLYAGDYIMIEETFTDVLLEFDDFVAQIYSGYDQGDRVALKSAVHKIKPLFGFVGLLSLQAQCQHFENTCPDADDPALAVLFTALKGSLFNVRTLIETEKEKLEQFNNG
jgi:hypothetical protein